MRRRLGILLALVVVAAATPAGAVFENLTVSPRARAMGDAAVAVADPAYAAYQNSAVLGSYSEGSVAASYVRPYTLGFLDLFYLGGSIPLSPKLGAIGLGLRHFAVNYEDVSLLKETSFTASHGIGLYRDLHSTIDIGYALNLYRVEFGETVSGEDPGSDMAVGLDASMYFTLHERTKLGVLMKNLNNPVVGREQEELLQRIHAGVAYEPYTAVITTFEIETQFGEQPQYHGGLEAEIVTGFLLRAGVMTNPSKLAGGFAYRNGGFDLSYGFSTGGGTLDSSHQFGVGFNWGGETP